MHRMRLSRRGSLDRKLHDLTMSDLSAVWKWLFLHAKVQADTGCWEWSGYRNSDGYGRIKIDMIERYTHRLSAICHGLLEPESDLNVLHACDNPPCFNPSHLRAGNQYENYLDAIGRGRFTRAKLTPADVREIRRRRALGDRYASIATDFGVTEYPVYAICTGRSWKHVA